MGLKRHCANFAWRDESPEYRLERENDRIVFRKIRKMTLGGLSADRAIAALFRSDFWQDRMHGKTRASWKRCYYRWRAKCTSSPPVFGDSVQAKKYPFDPCKHGAKRELEKFYRESFLSYPPPTATVPSAERKVINMQKEIKSEMRESPPSPPKESKGRNKRTSDGDGVSCDGFLRPRACACRGARAKRKREVSAKMLAWLERLDAKGFQDPVPPTVDEAVRVTGGTDDDRLQWMKICNRGLNTFLGVLMEFEYDLEKHTNHPLRNPAAAFQARLNRVLPKV